MNRKDSKIITSIINALSVMLKKKTLHNRENIEKLKDKVIVSSSKDREYICYILEGTLIYGISIEEAMSLLKRLNRLWSKKIRMGGQLFSAGFFQFM